MKNVQIVANMESALVMAILQSGEYVDFANGKKAKKSTQIPLNIKYIGEAQTTNNQYKTERS